MQIVMRQISGLGNQLFQYAAGRYYAKRHGASMRMVIDQAQNATSHGYPRPFLLSHFTIKTPMQPLSLQQRLLFSSRPSLKPAAALLKQTLAIQVFTEPVAQRFTFVESLTLAREFRTVYLLGYWQAYRFVDSIAEELKIDLNFKTPATGKNYEVLDKIARQPNTVSLHVRRGDYTLAAEGNIALPLAYYDLAIAYFQERLIDPVFFVFSDDIAFARANLPANIRAVFVDHNDDASAHEDLRLMSACHHHIIANSSFSWWGAWLNKKPGKMVYAPKYWHLKPESYFPDLLPPEWTLATL